VQPLKSRNTCGSDAWDARSPLYVWHAHHVGCPRQRGKRTPIKDTATSAACCRWAMEHAPFGEFYLWRCFSFSSISKCVPLSLGRDYRSMLHNNAGLILGAMLSFLESCSWLIYALKSGPSTGRAETNSAMIKLGLRLARLIARDFTFDNVRLATQGVGAIPTLRHDFGNGHFGI